MTGSYRAPAWLPGGHLQSIYPALLLRGSPPPYRRERWDTPDGDFIDVDHVAGPPDAPLVVLFHGLEGSSGSHYAASLMRAVRAAGWRGLVPHFRGCGGEPNRRPRAYHSGDSAEADWVLRKLKGLAPDRALFAAGVSLGGNLLLKWLGEQGRQASEVVTAAAAVSAPLDLHAAGAALERGLSRIYAWNFLQTLKPRSLELLRRYPGLIDGAAVRRVRTLRVFDDLVTAPLHGFRNVDDYWTRAASKPLLRNIAVPTLVLNARNDPFLPEQALPHPSDASPAVTLEFPEEGGHAGFVTGSFPGRLDWLPARLLGFFRSQLR